MENKQLTTYRTRIAPTPSGYLHIGHIATFLSVSQRNQNKNGRLIFRLEDIDSLRSKTQYCNSAIEDLKWLGFKWHEGPDIGGKFAPYKQSLCYKRYHKIWLQLIANGYIYPCEHSRKTINSVSKTNKYNEVVYSKKLRPTYIQQYKANPNINWRFRVPDNYTVEFFDQNLGMQTFQTNIDFGDFLIWRKDNSPTYELAVVADDHYMQITEVVRGQDLLLSTARQILIYNALGWHIPKWLHLPLVLDKHGKKLSKSTGATSIKNMRENNMSIEKILQYAKQYVVIN